MRLPFVTHKQAEAMARQAAQEAAAEVSRATKTSIDMLIAEGHAAGERPYALDNPWRYWVVQQPKKLPDKLVDVVTLRTMADTYDVLRSCINHLVGEVQATPLDVVPADPDNDSEAVKKRCKAAKAWLDDSGPLGGYGVPRRHFEAKMIEDVLVVGAYAAWYERLRGGGTGQVAVIDASTIKPRTDQFGWPDPETPYEQYVQGVQVCGFKPGEIRYDGLYPRSYSPYFFSPVEFLVSAVTSALKSDEWNRTWLTEGNVRTGDALALPADWTPEQVMQFQSYWDAMLAGDAQARQRTRFLPSGTSKIADHSRKDQDFQEFDLWLLRRTCSVMGVQPASIGFVGEQYKVSQDASMAETKYTGVAKLLTLRKAFYDDLFVRLGFAGVVVSGATEDPEDGEKVSRRLTTAAGGPYQTVNEARAEVGLDPIEGGDVLRMLPTSGEGDKPLDDDTDKTPK